MIGTLVSSSIGMSYVETSPIFDHLKNGSTNENSTMDCENICDMESTDLESNCKVMKISTEHLLIWTYANWGLFGFSLIHAIFVLRYKCF